MKDYKQLAEEFIELWFECKDCGRQEIKEDPSHLPHFFARIRVREFANWLSQQESPECEHYYVRNCCDSELSNRHGGHCMYQCEKCGDRTRGKLSQREFPEKAPKIEKIGEMVWNNVGDIRMMKDKINEIIDHLNTKD